MGDDTVKDINRSIHLAVIPDGNRRYARKRGKPVWYGHQEGAKKLGKLMEWCREYDRIGTVSVFALSTENLGRSRKELHHLWNVYKDVFKEIMEKKDVQDSGLRVNVLGGEHVWRSDVHSAARDMMNLTAKYSRMVLNIMLSYGSQFEIVDAVKKMIEKGIGKTKLVKKAFDEYLMVSQPVDLIIRTGGQQRLSNFLLYQSAYAEIYFSRTLWPAFTRKEFDRIMEWYLEQQRKFGK